MCVCVKYTLVVHVTDVLVMCNMEGACCSITAFVTELQRIGIVSITYLAIFSLRKKQRFFQGNCVSHQHISQVLYSSPVTKRPSAVGAAEEHE